MFNGANNITIKDLDIEDIENLLSGDGTATPAVENDPVIDKDDTTGGDTDTDDTDKSVTATQAFAHRLKDATTKARKEERESIAKELGYDSYEEMQKAREKNLIEDKGLDPDEVTPVVEQIVTQRLNNDPRMKELESLRQKQVNEWAKQELAELGKLTGGKINSLKDVPENVIELWKTKGSLKAAYLELEGEKLIREMQLGIASDQNKGSTKHLNSPNGNPAPASNERPFTAEERKIYKMFNPSVTDEQLSKMTKKI